MSSQSILRSSKATSRLLVLILSVATAVLAVYAFFGTPSALALDTITDRPDPGTWNTAGTVFATALSEDGRTLYIGGKFRSVRENPPGEPGESLRVGNVAAIDVESGAAIRTWTPQVTGTAEHPAVVHSLAVKDDKVFIGGNFTAGGGEPRQHLAAVDAVDGEATDGSVDPFAPEVLKATKKPWVYALLADDFKLYVGGLFNTVDGAKRANLAAFDLTTGELDPAWRTKTNNKVRDLEFASDRASIFLTGRFSTVTGSNGTQEARQSLARVHTDTGNLHTWQVPACPAAGCIQGPQQGWDLTVTPTKVYGGFGAGPNFAAAFHISPDPVLDGRQAWRFGTVGNVQTIALSPDGLRLFIGGHFGTNQLEQSVCGGRNNLSGLASLNPQTGSIYCDWLPFLEPSVANGNGPWTMTTTSSQLWVGGGFTHVSGVEQRDLARFTL